ncbi:MAG: dihydroorotate dehydrogenase electron transfer subunit [Firmicutes bacterium]|nr:dihydroorotate dehydrogenase electron transfer subunit [Bacillota bacterium]
MLTDRIYRLTLSAPQVAADAQPGQFVHVRTVPPTSWDPFLRRPLSIHDCSREEGIIALLYEVVGRGTTLLSRLRPGDEVDLLGPLGRGFTLVPDRRPVLVGGGLGLAPLLFLARRLREARQRPVVLVGCRRGSDVVAIDDFAALDCKVEVATEDGSLGCKGMVTTLAEKHLECEDAVYACGPRPMLAAIAGLCRGAGALLQVSLEEKMGCGIGACLVCACPTPKGYARVCTDGPVFWAEEVDLRG